MVSMKHKISIFSSAVLSLGLMGCGSSDDSQVDDQNLQGNSLPPVEYDLDSYLGNKDLFISAGTGRFRVEKKDDRWWFVTPEGNAFYSYAVQGVNSKGTADLDGNHQYEANILEKYGSVPAWAAAQADLLKDTGFNTIGDFSEWEQFTGVIPYMTGIHISGGAPIIAGQPEVFRGGARDFFHPDFAAGVTSQAQEHLTACANDAYCIGAFIDDEVSWAAGFLMKEPLFDAYQYLPAGAPGKLALQEFLEAKYSTIADFNGVWGSNFADFSDIQNVTEPINDGTFSDDTSEQQADRQGFRKKVAKHYYQLADQALDAISPTMLNMCGRFLATNMTPDVLDVAAEHCDVISTNAFELPAQTMAYVEAVYGWTGIIMPNPLFSDIEYIKNRHDVPVLLASFTYRAEAAGQNHVPPTTIFGIVENQTVRAQKFKDYMNGGLEYSNVVGAHWFIHSDQPKEGRWDGENSTFGMVTIKDEPYTELIDAMKEISYKIYPKTE